MTADRGTGLRHIETLLRQGRVEAAVAEHEELLRTFSRDLSLPNLVGDLYLQAGHLDRAVPLFFRAGNALLAEGFYARAAAFYKKVLKFTPGHEETLMRLSRACAEQGLRTDARACLNQVAEARNRRHDRQGLEEVNKALNALDRDVPAVAVHEAWVSADVEEVDADFAEFGPSAPVIADSASPDVEPVMVDILPEPEPITVSLVETAEVETDLLAFFQELEEEGEVDLTSMFDREPVEPPTSRTMAEDDATTSLDETLAALRARAAHATEQLALGRTLLAAGLKDRAREALESTIDDPEHCYEGAIELARLHQADGELDAVARWLDVAAAHAPSPAKRGAALYRLGLVLERAHAPARALAAFETLYTMAPDFRDVSARMARLQGQQGGGSSTR